MVEMMVDSMEMHLVDCLVQLMADTMDISKVDLTVVLKDYLMVDHWDHWKVVEMVDSSDMMLAQKKVELSVDLMDS